MNRTSTFALLMGSLFLLLSLLAPVVFGERQTWTDDLARRYQQASQQYHAALHSRIHSGPHAGHEHGADLGEAKRLFEQYQSRLQQAVRRSRLVAGTLRWLGVVSCGLGLILHFWLRYRVTDERTVH